MSSHNNDDYLKYVQEIDRFVQMEKEYTSTSDSESADEEHIANSTRQPISSVSEDGYFNLENRAKLQFHPQRNLLCSDSSDNNNSTELLSVASCGDEENFLPSEDPKDHVQINSNDLTATPKQSEWSSASEQETQKKGSTKTLKVVRRNFSVPKIGSAGPARKFQKKRKRYTREEQQRVDESVRRAKERFQHRTSTAQGNWRNSKTFGLAVSIKGQSTSKENNSQPKQEKLVCTRSYKFINPKCIMDPRRARLKDINVSLLWQEVQDLINCAVGEPCLSSINSSKEKVSSLLNRSPSAVNIQNLGNYTKSVTAVKNDYKEARFPMNMLSERVMDNLGDLSAAMKPEWENCTNLLPGNSTVPSPKPSPNNLDEDKGDQEMLSLESFGRSQNWARHDEGSYSPPSCTRVEPTRATSSVTVNSPPSGHEGSNGLKDTSRIPKSPWFRGKTACQKHPTTQHTENALLVRCAEKAEPLQSTENALPVHYAEKAQLVQSTKNASSVRSAENTLSVQPIQNVLSVQSPENTMFVPYPKALSVQCTKSALSTHFSENALSVHSTQKSPTVQTLENAQFVYSTGNLLSVTSTENLPSKQCPDKSLSGESLEKALPVYSSEKALSVQCIPIEHYVQFSESALPYVVVDGEVCSIQPEQWHKILTV